MQSYIHAHVRLFVLKKILANVRNGRKLEKGNINTSVQDDIISADICAIKPLLTESALNEEGAQLHACVCYTRI